MKGSLSMPWSVDHSMEEESQEAALDLRNVSTKIRHLFNNKHHQFVTLLVACLRDGDLSFSFLKDTSDDKPCPLLQSPIRWACHIAGIEMVSLGELKHNLSLLCAFFKISSNDETATFEKQTIKHTVNELATNHVDNYLQSIDIMFVHKHVRILPKCDAERSQFIIWLTRGSQELLVRRLSRELKQSNFALVLTHEACEQFQFVVSLLKLFQHNHVQMTQIVLEEDAIYGGSFLHWICCSNNAELYKLIHSHIPSESKYDCITSCCISGNADVLSIVLMEVKKEKALNWISKNEQPWINIYRKKQMSIEKVTTFKMPPLHLACYHGHVNIVSLLIASDYDLNSHLPSLFTLLPNGPTPVIVATAEGHEPVLKCLIAANCDLSLGDEAMDTSLHVACRKGFTDIVNLLVCQCNVSERNKDGDTPIHLACAAGYNDIVNTLLDHDADISLLNFRDYTAIDILSEEGHHLLLQDVLKKRPYPLPYDILNTPLDKACKGGYIDVVKILLAHKAYIFLGASCDHPLLRACQDNKVDLVKVLMETYSAASLLTTDHSYLLNAACRTKNVEIVKLLFEKGADPSYYDSFLYTAIEGGHVEIVKLLLDKGTDVQTTDDGYSPLREACRSKNVEIVKLLLDKGADPSCCDHEGYSCLHIAIEGEHVQIVKLLLEKGVEIVNLLLDKGANPSTFPGEGYSCVYMSEHLEIVKLLLDKGANVQTTDDGYSLLSEACRRKNVEIVKLLLEKGANPSSIGHEGYSCLHIAVEGDHVQIVKLLLDKGAVVQTTDDGNSLLQKACRRKNVEIVKLLLDKGVDPSAFADEGYRCLHMAVLHEHVEIVKLLLDKGGDVRTIDNGYSLLETACKTKNVEIVKLLLDQGGVHPFVVDDSYTCVCMAVRQDNADIVKLLLDKVAYVQTTVDGYLSLSEACRRKNVEIVKLLLRNGIGPSFFADKRYSCVCMVVLQEHVEIVKLLSDKVAYVQTTVDGYLSLSEACRRKSVEIVKLFLATVGSCFDAGVLPSAFAIESYSLMYTTVVEKHLQIVKLLLDKGADVQTTVDGFLSLIKACRSNILDLYIRKETNPSAFDDKGYSCLHIAVEGDHGQIVKLLLDKGGYVPTTDDGYSLLKMACRRKNVEIVKLLLDKVDLSLTDDVGYSCLHIAIQGDHAAIVRHLLEKGANVQTIDDAYSLLKAARRTGNVEIVKLLDSAADFSSYSCLAGVHEEHVNTDSNGNSSLSTEVHAACREGHLGVVKRLFEKGATVSAFAPEDYLTPEVVFRRGHFENVTLLGDNMDKMFFSDSLLRHHSNNLGILNSGEHVATGDNALSSLADNEEYKEHKQLEDSKVADVVRQDDSVMYKCHGRSQCIAVCRKWFDKGFAVCKLLLCHKDLQPVVEEIIEIISDSDIFTNNENSISGLFQILLYESVVRRKAYLVYILIAKCGKNVTPTITRQMLNVAMTCPNNAILQMLLKYSSSDLVDGDLMSCACSRGLLQVIMVFIENGYKFSPDHLRLALKHKHPIMTNLIVSNMSDPMPTDLVKELFKHGVKLGHGMIPILDSEIFTSFNSDQIMFEACFHEQFDILKLLIANGADVNCVNSGQKTLLHTACINDNETIVDFLIQSGICLNSCDRQGETPLHKAVEKNNSKVVQLLIKRGADVNCCSRVVSPLQLACRKGYISVIIILLKAGAEVNSFDTMQVTPVLHACKNRNFTVASLLLKHDAEVNVEDIHGTTPLHSACQHRDIYLIKLLLCHSADPFKTDKNKTCPLGFVVKDKDIMSIICEYTKGYALFCKDENGNTLLHHACMHGLRSHATNLLKRGIDSSQQNIKGESPMHIAVENENINLVRELLRNNCSHTVTDNDGKVPLHIASEEGYKGIVELLLDHTDKERVSATDNGGSSALHCASKCDKSGIIALLLEAGIRVNSIDQKGSTPLHYAAEGGYLDAVKLLVHAKADINAFGNKGHTPLHRACFRGHISVVNFLLDHNADAVIQNSHKNTPMYAACLGQHMDVVKLLLEKGDYQQVAGPNGYPCVVVAASRGDLELLEIMISHNAHLSPSNLSVSLLSNESDIQDIYSLLVDEEEGISHMKVDDFQQIAQDVDKSNMDSLVPIHLAYDRNHLHVFKQLVDNGAILSDLDEDGKTVFQKAFSNKDEDSVALILSKGFQPDMSSGDIIKLYPVIERCYSKQYLDVIKILYESWKIYSVNNTEHYTDSPVILAIIMDNISLLKCFLDMDGDFTERDEQGNTILHLACLMDNTKAVNVILQKQPHLLKIRNQDLKPLHVVCRQGSVELVKLFLQYSFLGETNYPDNFSPGNNACIYDSVDYHSAIEIAHEKRFTCIVNTLIIHKECFPIPSSNSIGESPFHWLCDSNDIGTLEAILKTDIDPSEQDGSGYTVLHKACERGNKQMVTMLLETGDHSSVFSNAGEAPLHILCRKGFVDLIQMFIDRGADMSVKTKDKNNSVLHVACMYKREEVCMFLLQRFACLSAEVNDDGYKPLDIAVERRCQKIVKLFVSVLNSKCLWYDYSDRICQKGDIHLLKFMIRCGVNLAGRDNTGNTFLHTAVSHGCVDVVLTLQKHCKEHFTTMSHMRNEQGELALHFAATKGDTAIVQTLMKYFIDPNVVDSNDSTPLHHASSVGSKDIVLLLLTSGADPFIADAKGNTPLHLAAKGGYEGVCSSLVVNNANCNARNAKGRTSVHETVCKGYLTITQLLIRSGAHVSVQDGRGDTPLHKACINEHSDMVQCLLDAGADLSISNLLGNTPLHIASMKGHVGIICQLLRHQELEAVNVLGQTVLHLASKNGHYNVLEIILKYLYRRELLGEHTRQGVSGRDLVNGDTALHLACRTGSVKSVELLKKYGAHVNVWNNNGNSPVFVACETGHVDIVKQCLHFAASGINRDGRSLLHIACRTGHEAMVKTLLEYGNVNITDRHGRTPLFDAVDNGHDIISTLLIRMGANVNSTNVYNRTPLHDACWEGRIGCVTLLTASGAQLDARNHYGNTPLHNACIQGHMAIGDLLLERGADSCPVNRVHMTPLHYACLYGYTETAKMLLSKGADPGMENSEGKTPLELCSSQDLKETLTSSCRDTDLTCRKRGITEVCALPPKKRMRMRIDTEEQVDEVGQRSSEDVRRAYISWRMINGTL